MKNKIFQRIALFLAAALLSGCAVLPFLPFLPIMGSAYDGYVFWKNGKAIKYYPFDLETTYLAVIQASDRIKLEVTLIKSASKEGYSLKTKGNIHMRIDTLPLEKSVGVTKVVISIPMFGDKQYVELFYSLIDDNLPRKSTIAQGEPQ